LEDGYRAEEHTGPHGEAQGKQDHRAVDADFRAPWHLGSAQAAEQSESQRAQAHTHDTAHDTHHNRFREHLASYADPGGTKGQLHGHLTHPGLGPCQHQVRDVDATDEENESHSSP
jgi:hypothetical protein